MQGKEGVPRVEIGEERGKRVGRPGDLLDDNGVTLESAVTFVGRQEKGKLIGIDRNLDRVAKGDLPVITKSSLVWEHQFTETH